MGWSAVVSFKWSFLQLRIYERGFPEDGVNVLGDAETPWAMHLPLI